MRILLVISAFITLFSCNKGSVDLNLGGSPAQNSFDLVLGVHEFSDHDFYSLQVDWDNKLIYGGNSDSTHCLSLFQYTDPQNVVLIQEFTSSSTPAHAFGECRNIKLYDDGKRLLTSSNGPQRVTRYYLGDTPEDPSTWDNSPTSFDASSGSFTRAIPIVKTNGVTTDIYFASHRGWFHVELIEGTGTFSQQAAYIGTTSNNTSVFDINNGYVLTRRYGDSSIDTILTDLLSGSVSVTDDGSIPEGNGINSNYWYSVSSDDGAKHVLLGQSISFIDSSGSSPVITRRERTPGGTYRAAEFISKDGKDYVYAATGSHRLDVYDVTDINNPILKYRSEITELGALETYGVAVNLDQNMVIMGTNKGVVAFLDVSGLDEPSIYNTYVPEVSVADITTTESAGLTMNITLDDATSEDISIDWETVDGTATAGADFTSSSGRITFSAGETSKQITVPIVDDGGGEGSENFQIRLINQSGVVIVNGLATVTLND